MRRGGGVTENLLVKSLLCVALGGGFVAIAQGVLLRWAGGRRHCGAVRQGRRKEVSGSVSLMSGDVSTL